MTIKSKLAVIPGKLGNATVEVLLDSGSSVSLVQQQALSLACWWTSIKPPKCVELVTASGEVLPVLDYVRAPIKVGELDQTHDFVVVENLVASVILA